MGVRPIILLLLLVLSPLGAGQAFAGGNQGIALDQFELDQKQFVIAVGDAAMIQALKKVENPKRKNTAVLIISEPERFKEIQAAVRIDRYGENGLLPLEERLGIRLPRPEIKMTMYPKRALDRGSGYAGTGFDWIKTNTGELAELKNLVLSETAAADWIPFLIFQLEEYGHAGYQVGEDARQDPGLSQAG